MNTTTPQRRALILTLGVLLSSIIGAGFMIISVETLGAAATALICATALLVYMLYMFYQIELSRQQAIDDLNKITKDFQA